MRAGNKRMTVQQVRRLVKIMDDVVQGNPKLDDKDKKSPRRGAASWPSAPSPTSRSTGTTRRRRRATTRPSASPTRCTPTTSTLFPDNPKAYDLRFFWAELLNDNLNKYDTAADEYTKVLLAGRHARREGREGTKLKPAKPGKWMINAAYNAILAWDEVVKSEAGQGQPAPTPTRNKKGTIPEAKKNLLEASERYLKYVDKGEKKVEITYKIAKIYYDYN